MNIPGTSMQQAAIFKGPNNTYPLYAQYANISIANQVLSKLKGYDTGGYTGDWNSKNGKLALLHEKELVLNQKDTKNILNSVNIVRSMNDVLQNLKGNFSLPSILSSLGSVVNSTNSKLDQNVHIDAHFPNVSSHSEIEKAFDNLLNHASQFINR